MKCSMILAIIVLLVLSLTEQTFDELHTSEFADEAVLSVGGYSLLWKIFMSDDTNADCKTLVLNYRYKRVTEHRLKTLVGNCKKHITDGFLSSNILKDTFEDFEDSCPKQWKFLEKPRPLVALASYPGSGNTWNRELIETTTGIHTGSIYNDWNFEGSRECPTVGKIFIVKTHREDQIHEHKDCTQRGVTTLDYSKALMILRNPFHALLAEFNRRMSFKRKSAANPGVGLANKEDFESKVWESYIKTESKIWKNYSVYWLKTFGKPVHVLVFERVQEQPMVQMFLLTQFLDMTIPFNSLYCLSTGSVGNFHRHKPSWMSTEKLFNNAHRKIVNGVIKELKQQLRWRNDSLDILDSYSMSEN